MLEDQEFVTYMRNQNMVQAAEQAEALNTLMKYVEDEGLLPLDQNDVRRRCLKEWKLPETQDIDREVSKCGGSAYVLVEGALWAPHAVCFPRQCILLMCPDVLTIRARGLLESCWLLPCASCPWPSLQECGSAVHCGK